MKAEIQGPTERQINALLPYQNNSLGEPITYSGASFI